MVSRHTVAITVGGLGLATSAGMIIYSVVEKSAPLAIAGVLFSLYHIAVTADMISEAERNTFYVKLLNGDYKLTSLFCTTHPQSGNVQQV